jgi:hypothetical protein
MKIADEHTERLRAHGLFVSDPRSADSCYPDGVLIGKPVSVRGNHIPNFSTGYVINLNADEEIQFDAPPVWLFGHGGVWVVQAQDHSPVPGPGDFINEWKTPEEAVQDIVDFYFGDPERMQRKAEAKSGVRASIRTI